MSHDAFYKSVGGRKYTPKHIAQTSLDGEYWNFGLIPEEQRTQEQHEAVHNAKSEMPKFEIKGHKVYDQKKVALFDLWKHPLVVQACGFEYPGTHQLTGSCVGAGGGNALFSIGAADAIIRNEAETPLVPFWLLPYGRSRFYLGDRGQGEGSTGTTFAKAVREDGNVPAVSEGLPQFKNTDALIWGESVEYKWSDGDDIPKEWMDKAKAHRVKTTAELKSADQVREAICNYYPVTIASNWGGLMSPPVTEGVLLSRRATSWSHQMSIQAWWEHEKLGEIFWIQNQWGKGAHGTCPSGAPGGGFWVKKNEIEWICDGNEVFAFSQYEGFPAQTISWLV